MTPAAPAPGAAGQGRRASRLTATPHPSTEVGSSLMSTALQSPLPSHPVLRLRLAPRSDLPRSIDGAWWPRSYDLLVELPRLLAGLPREWGHITSATVNGAWSAGPGRILVSNQVVRLRRARAANAPPTVVLLAPGQGRWDLVVVPPDTTEDAAEPLMAAAAGAQGEG